MSFPILKIKSLFLDVQQLCHTAASFVSRMQPAKSAAFTLETLLPRQLSKGQKGHTKICGRQGLYSLLTTVSSKNWPMAKGSQTHWLFCMPPGANTPRYSLPCSYSAPCQKDLQTSSIARDGTIATINLMHRTSE